MSAKKRIVTLRQIEVLVEFMEKHRDLAIGRLRSREARALSNRLWTQCAVVLNAESDGISRTPKEWQKWFTDYKCRILGRQRQIKQKINGSGGGDVTVVPLCATEERLCALLRGNRAVKEEQIDLQMQSSQIQVRPRQQRRPIGRRPKEIQEEQTHSDTNLETNSDLDESIKLLISSEASRSESNRLMAEGLTQVAAALAQNAAAMTLLAEAQQRTADSLDRLSRKRGSRQQSSSEEDTKILTSLI